MQTLRECFLQRKQISGPIALIITLLLSSPSLSIAGLSKLPDKLESVKNILIAEKPKDQEDSLKIPYEVSLLGLKDSPLLKLLKDSSYLVSLAGRPPATFAGLERRVKDDLERLHKVLRSEGYYDGNITYRVDRSKTPISVVVRIKPGEIYRLTEFSIEYVGDSVPKKDIRPRLDEIGVKPNMEARSRNVIDARKKLLALLNERSRPFPKISDQKILVNREKKSMVVKLRIDSGPIARFGKTEVRGLKNVKEPYARRILGWQQGEPYDSRKIIETRDALLRTRLFSTVKIDPASRLTESGDLPILVELKESAQRSIGAGFSFSTDIGIGGEVFWEHRNIFGQNETLRLTGKAAEIEQSAEIHLRKPYFFKRDQALLANTSFIQKQTDAFDLLSVSGFIGFERQWTKQLKTIIGLAPSYDLVDDNEEERSFVLLGIPLSVFLDTTNDRLNPTQGIRLDFSLTPYIGIDEDTPSFLTTILGLSHYLRLDKNARFVLAGRGRVGALVGTSTDKIPASRRFYAGGGGSIRGYEFQSVGPLDDSDDPLGGRSLIELSGEVRIRLTETIGVVPFIDGGTVFDKSYPTFDESIRWAAGIGFRYFTKIGPLRFDIAFPINRRKEKDDSFQFYINFGQAF